MQISDESEHIEAPPLSASFNRGIHAADLSICGLGQDEPLVPSGTQLAHQRDVVQNGYPGFSQELFRRRLEEIPVLRAKSIGFTNDRGLYDDSVVYIANR